MELTTLSEQLHGDKLLLPLQRHLKKIMLLYKSQPLLHNIQELSGKEVFKGLHLNSRATMKWRKQIDSHSVPLLPLPKWFLSGKNKNKPRKKKIWAWEFCCQLQNYRKFLQLAYNINSWKHSLQKKCCQHPQDILSTLSSHGISAKYHPYIAHKHCQQIRMAIGWEHTVWDFYTNFFPWQRVCFMCF